MKFQIIRTGVGDKTKEMRITEHGLQGPSENRPIVCLNPKYNHDYSKNTKSIDGKWYVKLNCAWHEAERLPDLDARPILVEVKINFRFPKDVTKGLVATAGNAARRWLKQRLAMWKTGHLPGIKTYQDLENSVFAGNHVRRVSVPGAITDGTLFTSDKLWDESGTDCPIWWDKEYESRCWMERLAISGRVYFASGNSKSS